MTATATLEADTLTEMRELDGRHVDADGIGHAYVAIEWEPVRERVFLTLYAEDDERICRCRLELDEVSDAIQHPFFYLRDYLPPAA